MPQWSLSSDRTHGPRRRVRGRARRATSVVVFASVLATFALNGAAAAPAAGPAAVPAPAAALTAQVVQTAQATEPTVTRISSINALPPECKTNDAYVLCLFKGNTEVSFRLPPGAANIGYAVGGSAGSPATGPGSKTDGGGDGAVVRGPIPAEESGKTVYIGTAAIGGENTLRRYGDFNGGSGGCFVPNGTRWCGGQGGAASVIGIDDTLYAVGAGGGGDGSPSTYRYSPASNVPAQDVPVPGDTGKSVKATDNAVVAGRSGGNGGDGANGGGGGGGGGGFEGGKGGAGCRNASGSCAGPGGSAGRSGQNGVVTSDLVNNVADGNARAGYVAISWNKPRTISIANPGYSPRPFVYAYSDPLQVPYQLAVTYGGYPFKTYHPTGTFSFRVGGPDGSSPNGTGVKPGFGGCKLTLVEGKGTCTLGSDYFPTPGRYFGVIDYSGDDVVTPYVTTSGLEVRPDPVKVSFTSLKNADGTYRLDAVAAPGIDKGVVDGTLSVSSTTLGNRLTDACPTRVAPPASVADRGISLTLECTLSVPPGTHPIAVTYTPGTATDKASGSYSLVADKFTPSVAFSLSKTLLDTPGAASTATAIITRPFGATAAPSGTVKIAPADGKGTSCDAALSSTSGLTSTYVCNVKPATGLSTYTASYAGDDTFVAAASDPITVTTVTGIGNLSLTPSSTSVTAGQPLTLAAKVTGPTGADATAGTVKVYDGIPIADDSNLVGTVNLATSSGGGTVTVKPGADAVSRSYTAVFADPTFQLGAASASTAPIAVTPLRSSVSVATTTAGEQTATGTPVNVTATVTVDSSDTIDADITMPTGSTSCSTINRTAKGADRIIAKTCSYLVLPGGNPTYTATYTDNLVGSLIGTSNDFTAPASGTTTAVLPAGAVTYGVSPALKATVTPGVTGTPVRGAITFTEGSTTLCSGEATPVGGTMTTTCSPSMLPTAGKHDVVATFVPDVETPTLTTTSTGNGSFTINPESVVLALSTARSGDQLDLLATTKAGAGNATDPVAAGSVKFGGAGSSCGTVALVGGVASCTVPMPAAGTSVTPTASYVPSADFAVGGDPVANLTYTAPASGACKAGFNALTARLLGGGVGHSVELNAGALGSASVTAKAAFGACDASIAISATATVDLFGGLVVAKDIAATVTQDEGLCITSGTLSLPTIWNSGKLKVTEAICFPLTAEGGISRPSTGALSLAAGESAKLPLVNLPGVTGAATLSARFGTSCGTNHVGGPTCDSPTPAVTLTATTPPLSDSVPGATAVLTVGPGGKLAGALTTTPVQVFGGSAVFTGSISRAVAADPISANIAATLTADISPSDGLSIKKGAKISVEGANTGNTTYSLGGTAQIAPESGNPVDVGVSGTFSSLQDYSVNLNTVVAKPWSPLSGLTLSPSVTGKLTKASGKTTWQVTAAGSNGAPLATWDAGAGVSVTIDQLSIGADATKIDKGCIIKGQVAAISGNLKLGDTTVPTTGCFAIGESGWHLSAASKKADVSSVSLADVAIDVNKPKDGDISLSGSGVVSVTVGSTTATANVQIIRKKKGTLVVSGNIDGTSLGVPGNAYVVYSTDDIPDWDTRNKAIGTAGKVKLKAGVTIYASAQVPASVASALADINVQLGTGAVVTLEAQFPKGADGLTVKAALSTPAQMPVLKLPGDSTVDSLVLTYGKGTYGLLAKGKISGQDGVLAPAELDLSFTSGKDFSGTAKVTGLALLGAKLDLNGSVKRVAGVMTSAVSGKLVEPVKIGDVTLENTTVSLGSDGLKANGDVTFTGTTAKFEATFASTKSYSLTVSANVSDWKPVADVTINAKIAGSLTRTEKGWVYSIGATPLSGDAFASIDAGGGVTVGLNSLTVSNGKVPTSCKLTDVKDSWIAAKATVALSQGPVTGSATGDGCFDTKTSAFNLAVNMPGVSFGGLGGKVRTAETVIKVSRSAAGKYTASGSARIFVAMPKGGEFSSVVSVTLTKDGFAVGGVADLSAFYDGRSAAHLYYASAKVDVDTGDKVLGTLTLEPGVTIGVDMDVSVNASKALGHLGVPVAAGSKVAATAHLDFATATLKLRVRLDLKPTEVFSTKAGERLVANKAYLELVLSPTAPSLGIQMEGVLHLPAAEPGAAPSTVAVSGGITLGTELRMHLTAQNWNDAFGEKGLNIKELTVQGGITLVGLPLPSLGVSATVTGLPEKWAKTIGYRQGAPLSLTLALSGSQFLLDIKIGTKGSSDVALQPFADSGKPELLQVNYAQLYLSPTGATVGTTTHPAGLSLDFVGKIGGVDVHVEARVHPATLSLYFKGYVGKIRFGSVTLGPTLLVLDVSPTKFQVDFSGKLEIGPVSGVLLSVFRYNLAHVKADLELSLGTGGISAKANVDVKGTVGERILPSVSALINGENPFQWKDYDVSFTLNNLGFAIDGNGLRVSIPNTDRQVRVPWPSASGVLGGSSRQAARVRTVGPLRAGDISPIAARATTAAAWANGSGTLLDAPALHEARAGAGTVLLADGRVLVVGGISGAHALRSAEIYDPATKTWTTTQPMSVPRGQPTLLRLKDGRVIAVGGESSDLKHDLRSAEIYDPKTGSWRRTAPMRHARVDEAAEVLPNGSVLVAGGLDGTKSLSTSEIWNPRTGRWHAGASMPAARGDAAVAKLPGGDLLVAGGFNSHRKPMSSVLRYDYRAGTWRSVAAMKQAQADSRAVVLRSGRILVAGDEDRGEVYDAAKNKWRSTGYLPFPVIEAALVPLKNGDALMVGGLSTLGSVNQVLQYRASTNTWVREPSLGKGVRLPVAVTMGNGDVLVAGGEAGTQPVADAWVYRP
ncbi:MAG: Kelch domain protein [Marmoricola sp.]|nr:Kelch domain protein [Marmoricola sp.]